MQNEIFKSLKLLKLFYNEKNVTENEERMKIIKQFDEIKILLFLDEFLNLKIMLFKLNENES